MARVVISLVGILSQEDWLFATSASKNSKLFATSLALNFYTLFVFQFNKLIGILPTLIKDESFAIVLLITSRILKWNVCVSSENFLMRRFDDDYGISHIVTFVVKWLGRETISWSSINQLDFLELWDKLLDSYFLSICI